jgi:hypothetical protein
MGGGPARGGDDLLLGSTNPAIGDVGADAVVEQRHFLADQSDVPAQAGQGHVPDIRAADEDGAAGHFVETRDQV